MYDKKVIREIPGFPGQYLTKRGNVYDSKIKKIRRAPVEGYFSLRVKLTYGISVLQKDFLVDAADLYRKVWNDEPPEDLLLEQPLHRHKLTPKEAAQMDIIESYKMFPPTYKDAAEQLIKINDMLCDVIKDLGKDPYEELRKRRDTTPRKAIGRDRTIQD